MRKKLQGFTVVELVIVLVLMTLLGAAVVPNMTLIYRQQIQKTANTLGMDLATLRNQARASGKEYTLELDAEHLHYTMTSEGGAVSALHKEDADNGRNITITMTAGGIDITKLRFKGNDMLDPSDTVIENCTFKIEYKDYSEYGEATFDQVSGKFSFEMKS